MLMTEVLFWFLTEDMQKIFTEWLLRFFTTSMNDETKVFWKFIEVNEAKNLLYSEFW
jgi:hypothetical protein